MLAVAGSETTRNSITQGMMAFTDNPDQWELFKAQRPKTAADEIIRWATPITAFQRTALEDYELSGVQIKKGQRVIMFYRSANFDEEVFDDPYAFNILRSPNPHVGFGGTGAHYCIGANLARMTINLIFNAVADHMPDLKPISAPERLRSGWLNGIKHWQVDYTGKSPRPGRSLDGFRPHRDGTAGRRRRSHIGFGSGPELERARQWGSDGPAGAGAPRRRRRGPVRGRDGTDRGGYDTAPGTPALANAGPLGVVPLLDLASDGAAGPVPGRRRQGRCADRGAQRTRRGAA